MAELGFSTDELLDQARGNQTAIWHLAVRWARERDGTAENWASYVAEDFAPSWDELGEDSSAYEVARIAGLNIATTADMRPVDLSGDDSRAVLTAEGPEREWLERMGTSVEELDRVNEVIFAAIARRRGLTLALERAGDTFRLIFTR